MAKLREHLKNNNNNNNNNNIQNNNNQNNPQNNQQTPETPQNDFFNHFGQTYVERDHILTPLRTPSLAPLPNFGNFGFGSPIFGQQPNFYPFLTPLARGSPLFGFATPTDQVAEQPFLLDSFYKSADSGANIDQEQTPYRGNAPLVFSPKQKKQVHFAQSSPVNTVPSSPVSEKKRKAEEIFTTTTTTSTTTTTTASPKPLARRNYKRKATKLRYEVANNDGDVDIQDVDHNDEEEDEEEEEQEVEVEVEVKEPKKRARVAEGVSQPYNTRSRAAVQPQQPLAINVINDVNENNTARYPLRSRATNASTAKEVKKPKEMKEKKRANKKNSKPANKNQKKAVIDIVLSKELKTHGYHTLTHFNTILFTPHFDPRSDN